MDCGGEEGPINADLLKAVSILSPNETELARLTGMGDTFWVGAFGRTLC